MNTIKKNLKKGFTLIELMVSMTVTIVIIGLLLYVTRAAFSTLSEGTDNISSYQKGTQALDQLANDLESLVYRTGNNYQWMAASADDDSTSGVKGLYSNLAFLTVARDRYDGDTTTNAGDVACVQYGIKFINPIDASSDLDRTLVLYRRVVDPDDTFDNILGQTDILSVIDTSYGAIDSSANVLCDSIRELSISLVIEYTPSGMTTTKIVRLPVLLTGVTTTDDHKLDKFELNGNGINLINPPTNLTAEDIEGISSGRISAIDINAQVLSADVIPFLGLTNAPKEKIEKGIKRFSKTIFLPQLN